MHLFSEDHLVPCSLGPKGCHKTTQVNRKFLVNITTVTEREQRLLALRANKDEDALNTICAHHHTYVKRYTTLLASKFCMDPFLEHTRSRRGTSVISLELAIALPSLKLVPGERLCPGCKVRCFQMDARFKQTTDTLTEEMTSSKISEQEEAFPSSLSLKFSAVGEIPLSMGPKWGQTYGYANDAGHSKPKCQ